MRRGGREGAAASPRRSGPGSTSPVSDPRTRRTISTRDRGARAGAGRGPGSGPAAGPCLPRTRRGRLGPRGSRLSQRRSAGGKGRERRRPVRRSRDRAAGGRDRGPARRLGTRCGAPRGARAGRGTAADSPGGGGGAERAVVPAPWLLGGSAHRKVTPQPPPDPAPTPGSAVCFFVPRGTCLRFQGAGRGFGGFGDRGCGRS